MQLTNQVNCDKHPLLIIVIFVIIIVQPQGSAAGQRSQHAVSRSAWLVVSSAYNTTYQYPLPRCRRCPVRDGSKRVRKSAMS